MPLMRANFYHDHQRRVECAQKHCDLGNEERNGMRLDATIGDRHGRGLWACAEEQAPHRMALRSLTP